MKQIFIFSIITLLLIGCSQKPGSALEFNESEKRQVHELNKKQGGLGILKNAEGENQNPKTQLPDSAPEF